jgi:hypothetical protein
MKTKLFGIILILISLHSCKDKTKNQINTLETQNETPQFLDENTDYKLSSISKRGYSDVISRLYKEALDKSLKLNELNEKISEISEVKNDSLEEYYKFSQTNANYWATADKYANQIQDSILKASTIEVFKTLDSTYKAKMNGYEQKLIEIEKKTLSLNDQLILMKLFITEPMMRNYQVNEKPNIETLESVIDSYDKLIKETEAYTQVSK